MFREEISQIKSGKKELREFGLTIGIILVILGVVALWRSKGPETLSFLSLGALFITLGFALPDLLKPLQKVWMSLAIVLGFFVSRIILTILFYLILTPMSLIARLLKKDVLDQKVDTTRSSYWLDREEATKNKESYENQY